MDIKYNVTKLIDNKTEDIKDSVSVEEPLEMNLKFKVKGKWHTENLSITMRTPGNDEDLISGFLFNERIILNINEIEKIEKKGEVVGDYNIQNKIEATINNSNNIDIAKFKRNFLINSSCGVCGKTSLDTVEVIKNEKLNLSFPKIETKNILKSPELLFNSLKLFPDALRGYSSFITLAKARSPRKHVSPHPPAKFKLNLTLIYAKI